MNPPNDARRRIQTLRGRGADAALGTETVDAYAAVTAQHRGLYWSVPAPLLFHTVDAHARFGRALLAARAPAALRARLAEAAAESLLLAGRIAFFDLQAPATAADHLLAASAAAELAGDGALATAILTHQAFIPAYAGRAGEARGLIEAAAAQGAGALGAVQSGWMHAVAAEVEARFGAGEAAMGLLDRAADRLTSADEPAPEWLDYFDTTRLEGFTGYCARIAGHLPLAEGALLRSLGSLPATNKQRAIVQTDLAEVMFADRRIDQCVAQLTDALGMLEQHWYATALHRIRALRTRLGAHRRLPEVVHLDERLRALTLPRLDGSA